MQGTVVHQHTKANQRIKSSAKVTALKIQHAPAFIGQRYTAAQIDLTPRVIHTPLQIPIPILYRRSAAGMRDQSQCGQCRTGRAVDRSANTRHGIRGDVA